MDTYTEILKIWNHEMPDDFEIYCQLWYDLFADIWEDESAE